MSASTAQMAQQSAAAGEPIEFGRRYQILPQARLPRFDSPHAQAFAMQDLRHAERALFGLICERRLLPRLDVVKSLSLVESKAFIRPESWGIVHWPAAGQERYIIVCEQLDGDRVFDSTDAEVLPTREDELSRKFMRPLIQVLADLHGRHIAHRAIRADNLFFRDEDRTAVALGECVSEPPGFSQPAIYETIESGLAKPAGRGFGHMSQDIYALGVLLVVVLHGGDPCAGMTEEEVVASKVERGSYATLLSKASISLTLMEPLRGMLCDDPRQRWGVQDVLSWLDGRQQTPRQQVVPPKVARSFPFKGQDYTNLRALANAMAQDWDAMLQAASSDRFRDWVGHVVANNPTYTPMLEGVSRALAHWPTNDAAADELAGFVLIALDPQAPIRFKGLAANIESLGQALAIDFHDGDTVQQFKELVIARLPLTWLDAQIPAHPNFLQLKREAELVEFFMKRQGWGQGMERSLYELRPGWPCESPILKDYLVCDITQLLPALEKIAAAGPPEFEPVDRHVTAFCAAQLKKLVDRALYELDRSEDEVDRRTGMIRLLSVLQKATACDPLPAVARWMSRLLSPAIEIFHNRPYRRKVAIALEEAAGEGDLMKLLTLVDNRVAKEQDQTGFEDAKLLFAQAGREIEWLEQGGLTNPQQVMKGSQQAAILFSSLLSGLALLAFTVMLVT